MSETAKKLFQISGKAGEAALARAGESLERMPAELIAEGKRLGTQGGMEAAAGINHGNNFFVPYGPGQYTPNPDLAEEHSRGMER